MKYIITESKLNDIIYDYIKGTYYPDYDMGADLHDFYIKDVKTYGYFNFLINDVSSYVYLGGENVLKDNKPRTLVIGYKIKDELNDLFGDMWESVFIKWFEDHSGLKVDHLVFGDL